MPQRKVHRALQTRVVCVGNQKGGVGKTTTCIQLAGAFAEKGRRSLIIDLDMTCGATKSLRAPTEGWNSAFDLITGGEGAEDTIIDGSDPEVPMPPGIHLVPGSAKLAELDQWLYTHEWIVHQDMLMEPLARLRGRYEYIFLDTPPQKTKTTIPALKAADYVILSTMPDRLAVEALSDAIQQIATARQGPHPGLSFLGVVVCAMPNPKTRLAKALIDSLRFAGADAPLFPIKFETEISRTVVVQEATHVGQTIFQYERGHRAAEEYLALADEVERRIALITAERGVEVVNG